MEFQPVALVPVDECRRRREKRYRRRFLSRAAQTMILCFVLGFLIGLVWVRSLDKPEGGTVPRVSITYEEVGHGTEEHR